MRRVINTIWYSILAIMSAVVVSGGIVYLLSITEPYGYFVMGTLCVIGVVYMVHDILKDMEKS